MTTLSSEKHYINDKSHGFCSWLFSANRRKNRCLILLGQIVAVMWFIGISLQYITNDRTMISSIGSNAKKQNVFESFKNYHDLLARGHGLEDFDDIDEDENSSKTQPDTSSPHKKSLKRFYFDKSPILPEANCLGVVKGEPEAIEEAALLQLELRSKQAANKREQLKLIDNTLMKMTDNCTEFLLNRKYFTNPLTSEEKAYPIAYIITIHNKFSMFERLLRSIYHPQNLYCVHVDKKSPKEFLEGVKKLTQCFPNVFVPSKLTEVYYTHWSRAEADINCFEGLAKKASEVPWTYVLNLCGQDFPLKTNLEIVRSLKSLQGYNNMETFTVPEHKKKRFELHYERPKQDKNDHQVMERTETKKSPSPLDSPMFAGSAYYIWKREAVEFMLRDSTVQKFFEWNKDSYSPDEHMWATLQRWYPNVPGSFPPHAKYDLNELQSITRLVKWGGLDKTVYPKCAGQFRRGICVYGTGDLSWLLQQHHLFANKFDFNVDPYAIDCLDIWLRNRTILQSSIYLSKGFV